MPEIRESLDALIRALENCEDFKRYKKSNQLIQEYPDKKKRMLEFRKKNYLIQNAKEDIDLFTESERLQRDYADLYKDPVTAEFLAAEVAVCRILQQVNREMIECLDFENVLTDD